MPEDKKPFHTTLSRQMNEKSQVDFETVFQLNDQRELRECNQKHYRSMNKRHGFRLFLYTSPMLILVFFMCYLPIYGWIYAFFNYQLGSKLSNTPFVGFQNFIQFFDNAYDTSQTLRVLANTFGMALLGLVFSPLSMIFAILLNEMRVKKYKRVIQSLTTIPNFISWVLVYSLAFAMFSTNGGFLNQLLMSMGIISKPLNILGSSSHVWLTMTIYGIWKSLGWSALMYLASITSINGELYEAARVDGAGRFRCIWHITIPGLLPTFFVLLVLSVANFINVGFDQYYVFQNAMNRSSIEVIDLFVYNQGIMGRSFSFATAVSMLKSVVSIVLLFGANYASKLTRGESVL